MANGYLGTQRYFWPETIVSNTNFDDVHSVFQIQTITHDTWKSYVIPNAWHKQCAKNLLPPATHSQYSKLDVLYSKKVMSKPYEVYVPV